MIHLFENNNISLHLADLKVLYQGVSKIGNSIELYTHSTLGKVLVINNEIQHTEAWAPLYHENLVHIPGAFVPKIESVLILGGGSFYAACEVLKYNSIERIVMVDHDFDVIDMVAKHYPHASTVMGNSKFQLINDDAIRFLNTTPMKFDLIINDAVDLLDNSTNVFETLARKLTAHGICCDVVYRNIFETARSQVTIERLQQKFHSAFSLMVIPEYPGILHLLSLWSNSNYLYQDRADIVNEVQKEWMTSQSIPCEYYNPTFLRYYMHLPPYLKKRFPGLQNKVL